MGQELIQLMEMLGGRSTPPGVGGPQPPQGTPYPFGAMGGNDKINSALQGIGAMSALGEMRKFMKTSTTVGMQLDKPTRVDPMSPGLGQADIQARAAQMGAQQMPGGAPGGPMPGGMPGGPSPMPGGMPMPGGGMPGMPPGGPPQPMPGGPQMPPSPNIGALMAMLAQRGMR